MINNVSLVSGFAHKDKSNIFSNVLIKDGIMTAQNDLTGISVDVESDIDFCCNAVKLNQSLKNCNKDNYSLSINKNKLQIKSGRFSSNIELTPIDHYPLINHGGDNIEIQSDILSRLNSIAQFTDPNDVRPALRGVAICEGFVKATNGHVAIKKTITEIDIDEVIIPTKSIQSMMKANTVINFISVDSNRVFFNFENGFLFTRTIDGKMPDIDRILTDIKIPTDISLISDAVKSVASMIDQTEAIIFNNAITTRSGDVSIDGFDFEDSAFKSDYLMKIIDVADRIDLSQYPGTCPFDGDDIVGAVAPMKL